MLYERLQKFSVDTVGDNCKMKEYFASIKQKLKLEYVLWVCLGKKGTLQNTMLQGYLGSTSEH